MSKANIPSIDEAKMEAIRLGAQHDGAKPHSQCLEEVAKKYGFRDWNTFSAAAQSALLLYFITGEHHDGDGDGPINLDWFITARTPSEAKRLWRATIIDFLGLDEEEDKVPAPKGVYVVPQIGKSPSVHDWNDPKGAWDVEDLDDAQVVKRMARR